MEIERKNKSLKEQEKDFRRLIERLKEHKIYMPADARRSIDKLTTYIDLEEPLLAKKGKKIRTRRIRGTFKT